MNRLPQKRSEWEQILAWHEPWLRAVVRARVRDGEVVDEVMQEVFLAAARHEIPTDRVGSGRWLYRVAVRQALLYRRRRERIRRLAARYGRNGPPPHRATDGGDPLQWLLDEERRQHVRTALEELPGRDAEILLLKYTQEFNYGRLSEYLGISRAAVEARLHRARQRLRSALTRTSVVEVQA